jgi:phosphoribosyl 1,2-cyclic phosphodiesterase
MKVSVLASGSKGNCTYLEGESGALLIDAGLSAREIRKRLEAAGGKEDLVEAVLVTHEHGDHIRGVDVLARRLDIPVVATRGTLHEFLTSSRSSSKTVRTRTCRPGETLEIGEFRIEAFQTSHDAVDPCGFLVQENGATFGICTDTGEVTGSMTGMLGRCDALVLESNHCPEMLKNGPYPAFLKRRISDRKRGHLSNTASAACLGLLADRLAAVMLAHLSEENNTPEKAYASAKEGLGLYSDDIRVHIARQHAISDPLEI